MENMTIRKATQEEASQIAELFLLAWPLEEIAASNGITYKQLHESITAIASMHETIYSFENTYVAETENKIVGAMCGYDGALYRRLGFTHVGYRDFFGHQMKHMTKKLER